MSFRRIHYGLFALCLISITACASKPGAIAPVGGQVDGTSVAVSREDYIPKSEAPQVKWKGEEKKAAPNEPDNIPPIEKGQPNTENYDHFVDNPFLPTAVEPLSTFSVDVNTASYSNLRRFMQTDGKLPPPDAVRIAELINYFNYDYPKPKGDDPVAFGLEIAPCPWNPTHKLLRIAMAAKKYDKEQEPPRNLVFLIDTSGSMGPADRLPLVKQSLGLLIDTLTGKDHVSIVTYAGDSRVVLQPTSGDQKEAIRAAVNSLSAGGGTNGGGGIEAAYNQAKQNIIPGGINRVILMTDGDFNVGIRNPDDLVRMIEEKRKTGVFLTILGYGRGNLKDNNMEQLARHGNGHYAYIDTIDEARKVFVDQGAALVCVAKDVKLQIVFNPKRVLAHRLIGYENRLLKHQDFNDDTKDAGDMGSGHTVTALYEIVPVGVKPEIPGVDPAKYVSKEATPSGEWMTVKMRFKQPDADESKLIEVVLPGDAEAKNPSIDFRFASAVSAWGMLMRKSPYKGKATIDGVIAEVQASRGVDADGLRAEFLRLVTLSKTLQK